MLILLPPSEGKTAPDAGCPVDLSALWLPTLAPARRRVLSRLVALSGRTSRRGETAALAALGLTAGQRDELARNAALTSAPAAPAGRVYTGVLYEALDLPTLGPAARDAVEASTVVFSGLWGAVRLTDAIPAYRCAIGASLPVLGGLAAYWRKVLAKPMNAATTDGPVLDLRSGSYAAMWTPTPAVAVRTVTLRVLHERVVDGVARRSVVSHFNKASKGRLVRDLATAGVAPASVDDLVSALRDLKYTVEPRPAPAGRPRQLDVVVTQL
jgi:cytoplasmic iron level regulating protein YaaA (DUF328/UPF0246 family)